MPVEVKVVVLGQNGSGKSSIVIKFVNGIFGSDIDITIEDTYYKQVEYDGEMYCLEIFDTVESDDYSNREFKASGIRNGDVFLCVYSITNRNSFETIPEFIENIMRIKDLDKPPKSIVIVGNKSDVETSEREVQEQEGIDLAKKYGAPFFETSAKRDINLRETFEELTLRVNIIEEQHNMQNKRK